MQERGALQMLFSRIFERKSLLSIPSKPNSLYQLIVLKPHYEPQPENESSFLSLLGLLRLRCSTHTHVSHHPKPRDPWPQRPNSYLPAICLARMMAATFSLFFCCSVPVIVVLCF